MNRSSACLVLLLAAPSQAVGRIAAKAHGPDHPSYALASRGGLQPHAGVAAERGGFKSSAGAAMRIDGVYDLAPQEPDLIRKFDPSTTQQNAEEITVYKTRGRNGDAEWRAVLLAQEPAYEANNSEAAQRLYSSGPFWTGPEHQRLMSDAKDALGLCGALGGWVTCPNK